MLFRSAKRIYLKALEGAQWRVESKPDWITVTPSNGAGKTEISMVVNDMANNELDRNSEVVFRLDGTEERIAVKVEQFNYKYNDGDIITLQRATVGAGVNIVLMGDCYNAKDINDEKYINNLTEAYNHLFSVEPMKSYKEYYNVYAVVALSEDSGVGTINDMKRTKFESRFTTNGSIYINNNICFDYAMKAPINNNLAQTAIIVVPNSNVYTGITYMWDDGSAISVCPVSREIGRASCRERVLRLV